MEGSHYGYKYRKKRQIVEVESNRTKIQVDLASYKPGIYFILVTNPAENQIINRLKVIKSH